MGALTNLIEHDSDCRDEHLQSVGVAPQPAALLVCERTANIFRALGDVNRLRLLSLLANREMCVSELTLVLRDNLPAISQRLKLLRAERLVSTRRQGKHVFYRLADRHIAELIANGLAHGQEHEAVPRDRVDYIANGQLHSQHNGHCDIHGPIKVG